MTQYKIPKIEEKVAIQTLAFAEVMERVMCNRRAGLDIRTRNQILRARGVVTLKTGGADWDGYFQFWSKYAAAVGVEVRRDSYMNYPQFPVYVQPDQSVGYFTSDSGTGMPGFESLMHAQTLYADAAIHLSDVDHDHPMVHMLEGFLAILGPALGFACTFIGDEKYSGTSVDTFSHRQGIEQTEWWWREWNKYLGPQNSIQSVCGAMHKDDIVLAVTSNRSPQFIGSCDHKDTVEGGWCGDCWKCCSTSYILWAHRGSSEISASRKGINQMITELEQYRSTGADLFRSVGLLERVERRTGRSVYDFLNDLHPSSQGKRVPDVLHVQV